MMLTAESITRIRNVTAAYPQRRSAILPALTIAYHQMGHLSDDIYREIADTIDVPYVEVAEAATFYTMFPKEPVGKYLIQVCHNISCALLGASSAVRIAAGQSRSTASIWRRRSSQVGAHG